MAGLQPAPQPTLTKIHRANSSPPTQSVVLDDMEQKFPPAHTFLKEPPCKHQAWLTTRTSDEMSKSRFEAVAISKAY